MAQVTSFNESDDPFGVLRKVFIDFGYHKFTKFLNASFTVVSCLVMSLVFYFTIKNFNKDLIIRYAPSLIVLVYILVSMIVTMVIENEILQLANEQKRLFWSINSAGSQARLIILKKASRINCYTYIIYTVSALWSIVLFPVFGSHREWMILEDVFDQYFGSSSKMLYQIFFSFVPFAIYSALRHIGILLYNTLQLSLQIFLINQHISQISDDKTVLEKLSFEKRHHHQNQTFKKLCFCIEHHIVVTRVTKKMFQIVRSVIAVFLLLGALISISALYSTFYIYEDSSNILKIRLCLAIMFNVVVVVTCCHAGQMLIDESGYIFDTLTKCPWYEWDKRNKTVLHIFMTNSLKPFAITFAGIVVDYKLAITMFRTASSYALVFYNLQKAA